MLISIGTCKYIDREISIYILIIRLLMNTESKAAERLLLIIIDRIGLNYSSCYIDESVYWQPVNIA